MQKLVLHFGRYLIKLLPRWFLALHSFAQKIWKEQWSFRCGSGELRIRYSAPNVSWIEDSAAGASMFSNHPVSVRWLTEICDWTCPIQVDWLKFEMFQSWISWIQNCFGLGQDAIQALQMNHNLVLVSPSFPGFEDRKLRQRPTTRQLRQWFPGAVRLLDS